MIRDEPTQSTTGTWGLAAYDWAFSLVVTWEYRDASAMASLRLLASGIFVLALAACGGLEHEQPLPGPLASAGTVADAPRPTPAKALLKQVARSVWGVVPDPPRRKQDLKPELIRGTAVAVAPDTLLARCQAVGQRRQAGV